MNKARGIRTSKTVGVVVAATAASLMATTGAAYAAPGFTPEPTKKHHHHHHDGGNTNAIQAPTQVSGNNIGNNIGLGVLGHGSAKGGNNHSKSTQKTTAH